MSIYHKILFTTLILALVVLLAGTIYILEVASAPIEVDTNALPFVGGPGT